MSVNVQYRNRIWSRNQLEGATNCEVLIHPLAYFTYSTSVTTRPLTHLPKGKCPPELPNPPVACLKTRCVVQHLRGRGHHQPVRTSSSTPQWSSSVSRTHIRRRRLPGGVTAPWWLHLTDLRWSKPLENSSSTRRRRLTPDCGNVSLVMSTVKEPLSHNSTSSVRLQTAIHRTSSSSSSSSFYYQVRSLVSRKPDRNSGFSTNFSTG